MYKAVEDAYNANKQAETEVNESPPVTPLSLYELLYDKHAGLGDHRKHSLALSHIYYELTRLNKTP